MEMLTQLLDLLMSFDVHLMSFISLYGVWVYVLLFIIIFCETGLVVTPFLPGDSLLFAAGALAGQDLLNVWVLLGLLFMAGFLGDSVNYWLGRKLGVRLFNKANARVFKQEYLHRTHEFYESYGAKAIILARFMPILRTFVPFVAGIGRMRYDKFTLYNLIGAALWSGIFVGGGFWFGNLPFMRDNFTLMIGVIVIVSILPAFFEYGRYHLSKRRKHLQELPFKEPVEKSD